MSKLTAKQRNALPDSSFAYVDSDGVGHLPINDENHVRAAMSRWNQTSFESPSAKAKAHAKIVATARKYGIEVSEFAEPPQKDRQGGDDPDMPGDDEDDEDVEDDDDDIGVTSFIDSGDVHADTPVGVIPPPPPGAGKQKPSRFGTRLVRRLREALKVAPALSSEQIEAHIASARGHAGGMAKAASRKASEQPCEACESGDPSGCGCAMCASGNHAACTCCETMRLMAEGKPTPTDPDGDGDDDTDPEGDTDDDYAGANPPKKVPAQAHEPVSYAFERGPRVGVFMAADVSQPWIPYLPKPGVFTHPQWGKISISKERNARFVENFKRGVYQSQLPMDAEHQTKLSGALAWIRDMRQNADGSVDAFVEYTERGRQMLANDAYRYVSPEFFESWTDPATGKTIQDVASGGAFTVRPFFKDSSLRPLVAHEGAVQIDRTPLQEYTMPQEQTPNGEQGNPSTAPDPQPQHFAELQAELAQQRQMTEAAQAEARQASEKIAAMERESRLRSFAETARAFAGNTDTDTHVKIMDALPDDLRESYVTSQRAMAEQIKTSTLFDQFGRSGRGADNTAEGQLTALAEKMTSESSGSMTFAESYDAVMKTPRGKELYDQSVMERAN